MSVFQETVAHPPYTGRLSSAVPAIEVVAMAEVTPIVFVVDDDISVRESLQLLITSAGWRPETFASAPDLLARPRVSVPSCLVLDVTMPGMTGPGLQQELKRRKRDIPIVFITAHSDEDGWQSLLSSGAAACLIKPFSERAILDAIRIALGCE